jgi:hypothetical protein
MSVDRWWLLGRRCHGMLESGRLGSQALEAAARHAEMEAEKAKAEAALLELRVSAAELAAEQARTLRRM